LLLQWAKANVGIVSRDTETIEIGLLSQWAKANVGFISGDAETVEFGLVSQWAKANVGIDFQSQGNQQIWFAFKMSESQCWYCFS
jgi:hypothetical protein